MASHGDDNPGSGFGGPRYPGTFLLALREAIAKLKWQATMWRPNVVECVDAEGKSQQIGMENLYRRLRREKRDQWPAMLLELLKSVPAEAGVPPENLDAVADRLLVRLGAPISRQEADVDIWSRPLVADHIAAFLVIDHPNSMSYVTTKLIADSAEDGAAWFDVALANLLARSPADTVKCVHEESGLLQAQAGDAYDSSRALLLDQLTPGHEENGFFVIAPGRDHLLFVPITTETLALAPWLRAIASKSFREMPYPISPELFWVRAGVWHHFVVEADGEDIVVKPPLEFLKVLERLRSPDSNDEPGIDDSDAVSN